uniref:Uncharacterized protein n=1 Tax=Arundo donax TaxID=35708 RepID=A0A0A8ZBY9_ARUDO
MRDEPTPQFIFFHQAGHPAMEPLAPCISCSYKYSPTSNMRIETNLLPTITAMRA